MEKKGISVSFATMRRTLNRMGFYHHKKHGRRFLKETPKIVADRHSYLRKIRAYREAGYQVVYLDETWVNSNHTCPGEWSENRKCPISVLRPDCQECGRHIPSGKGSRLIVLDAGSSRTGFIPDVGLVFESKTNSQDYHDEMNSKHFLDWFTNTLMPALDSPSVIVMDNAPYHNTKTKESAFPKTCSTKGDICTWLTQRGVTYHHNEIKAELLQRVKIHKPPQMYETDAIAMEHGHEVLRLPVRHCELNPIELIQGEEKMYVASRNCTFKLRDVKTLFMEARGHITREKWEKAENHVIKCVEDKFWEIDGVTEEVAEVVIDIDDDESESDSDSLSDSDLDQSDEEYDENYSESLPPLSQISITTASGDCSMSVYENESGVGPKGDCCSMEEEDDEEVCNICLERNPPTKMGAKVEWVACDMCDRWLHVLCCKNAKMIAQDRFVCSVCKAILSTSYK
ncbi:hypothetical protein ScPMuIL_016173 [Solemya velum]